MTNSMRHTLPSIEEIEDVISNLDADVRKSIEQDVQENPNVIFDWAARGEIISLAYTIRQNGSLLERQDERGQNLLHYAANDHSGVMASILTQKPTEAIWQRDTQGDLPLDTAESCRNGAFIDALAPCTYPELYLEEVFPFLDDAQELDAEQREKLEQFAELAVENGHDTKPSWAETFEPQRVASPLISSEQDHDNERSRD